MAIWLDLIRWASHGGQWNAVEIPIRGGSGGTRIVLWNSAPLKNSEGLIVSTVAQGLDITERKAAEEALRESEATYRGLFNTIPLAIFIHDAEARIIDINDGAIALFGYSREEFIGRTPDFLPAAGRHDFNSVINKIHLAFSGIPQQEELWARRKNGEMFLNEILLYKGVYFGQDVLIAIATNITERRQSEEALRKSEKNY